MMLLDVTLSLCTLFSIFVLTAASCDFETKCQWKILPNERNFEIKTGKNRSNLEPNNDHTLKSQRGHYAILNSNKVNASSHLVSPWYEGASQSTCQLNFYLHMSKTHPGSLEVVQRTVNATRLLKTIKKGQTKWKLVTLDIGKVDEPFQIEIIGNRSAFPVGHIAVDDIRVKDCRHGSNHLQLGPPCNIDEFSCQNKVCLSRNKVCNGHRDCLQENDESEAICGEILNGTRCDFESRDTCGWEQWSYDDDPEKSLDWILHRGKTPTDWTGPSRDHTYNTKHGHYLYIETDKGTPTSVALLTSPVFPKPDPVLYDRDSPYYNLCNFTFYYHMFGDFIQGIDVSIINVETDTELLLWKEFHTNKDRWIEKSIPIPNINYRYQIEIRGKRGMRNQADVAIDDLFLSPECYGQGLLKNTQYGKGLDPVTTPFTSPTSVSEPHVPQPQEPRVYKLTPCGNTGQLGPSQNQCDQHYGGNLSVQVVNSGQQVWTVPKTAVYRLTVAGANSGYLKGSGQVKSSGSLVTDRMTLVKGEQITMVIGQKGSKTCLETGGNRKLCELKGRGQSLNSWSFGAGGATYVFKMDTNKKNLVLLVVTGGAGSCYDNQKRHGNNANGQGFKSESEGDGKRWSSFEGRAKDKTCTEGRTAYGGYGRGGSSCTTGGTGGGGYIAGKPGHHCGQGGISYLAPGTKNSSVIPGGNHDNEDGFVTIEMTNGCPCEQICLNSSLENFKCGCLADYMLDGDLVHCSALGSLAIEKASTKLLLGHYIAIGAGGGFVMLLLLSIVILHCYHQHRLRNRGCQIESDKIELQPTTADQQLLHMRQQNSLNNNIQSQAGANILTERNPNYDPGLVLSVEDLREVPRNHLKLVKALGQGAFGEVYMGYLSNIAHEARDMSVAVKTLPALCTDQAEMDFLTEALIMSKFNHPNIVRFIGVCFEKHPRYIVLELLDGGDLKTFLREARPKRGSSFCLKIGDFLKLSLDIAKGCLYLEDNRFIHRDIAARNCLLTTRDCNRVAKIADFGMARDIYRADYYRKDGKAMLPVKWMPPEAFLDGLFTSKTDVWSFGVLLWEVFSMGYMPYPGRGNQEVMQLVTSGGRMDPPDGCPTSVFHIMRQCWYSTPTTRPDFASIIKKLEICLHDPAICQLHLPKPKTHDISIEQEATLMRPHASDPLVLSVRSTRLDVSDYLEPESPATSEQPLLSPRSPLNDIPEFNVHGKPKPKTTFPFILTGATANTSKSMSDLPPHFSPPPPPKGGSHQKVCHNKPLTPDSGLEDMPDVLLLSGETKKNWCFPKQGNMKRKSKKSKLSNVNENNDDVFSGADDNVMKYLQVDRKGGRLNSTEGSQSNTSDLCGSEGASPLSTTSSSLSSMDETVIHNQNYSANVKLFIGNQSMSEGDLTHMKHHSDHTLDNHIRPWSHDPSVSTKHSTAIEMTTMKLDKQNSGDSGVVVGDKNQTDEIVAWL